MTATDPKMIVLAGPQQVLWNKIWSYDLNHPNAEPGFLLIDRLMQEHGWDFNFAERAIGEFRRFLLLLISSLDKRQAVPSSVVDAVRHETMLFNQLYLQMSEELAGRLIGHRPAVSPREVAQLSGAFEDFLGEYRRVFQTEPPSDIWFASAGSWGGTDCCSGTD